MPSKNVSFAGSDGQTLTATIDFPDGPTRGWALFAHCFTCNRKAPAAVRTCRALAAHGIACLRFDFTGLGTSGGDFSDTTFLTHVADLRAAHEFLAAEYSAPSLIIGHSLGGAIAMYAAPSLAGAAAVVTIGTPFDPRHVLRRFTGACGPGDGDDTPETAAADSGGDTPATADSGDGALALCVGGREITVSGAFMEPGDDLDPNVYVRDLRMPLLVMHAPHDAAVNVGDAERIFHAARHPKSMICLDDADHLLLTPGSPQRAADLIATWAEPYLPGDAATADPTTANSTTEDHTTAHDTGDGREGEAR